MYNRRHVGVFINTPILEFDLEPLGDVFVPNRDQSSGFRRDALHMLTLPSVPGAHACGCVRPSPRQPGSTGVELPPIRLGARWPPASDGRRSETRATGYGRAACSGKW